MTFCNPRSFPFGYNQTLLYYVSPSDQIQVQLDNANFRPEGDGYLGYFGYDRWQDPDLTRQISQSVMGSSIITGPVFVTPYRFAWNLQQLTVAQYQGLWAMFKRQQFEKKAVRLFDTRLAMDEAGGTRRRAKCGPFPVTGAPAISGMQFFYAQFDVWLEFGQERESYNTNKFALQFTGVEMNPAYPVPVSSDV